MQWIPNHFPAHLVVIEIVNESDEASSLGAGVQGELGDVLYEEGVKMAAKCQIVCSSERL